MRNFDNKYRGDFRGGDRQRRSFGDRDRGRDRDGGRERSQMHEAICSDCGKRCEVPFRPSGDKPVYCSQCFGAHRGNSSSSFERKSYDKPDTNQYKEQFEALNAKLDRIIKILTPVVPEKEEKKEKEDKKEKKEKKNKKEKHE